MSKSADQFHRLVVLASGLVLLIGTAAAGDSQGDRATPPDGTTGLTVATASDPAPDSDRLLGLGRAAHPGEIAAWDVDILPDGRGLPEGSGSVLTGEAVFIEKCASCHGDFAEGLGNFPSLAGGFGTLDDRDPVKTVGSYWPYLSTVWDYVHRSMPFGDAGTLSDDEVYAITAYILYSNDLVSEDFTLSTDTFSQVAMPNAEGFIVDDRPETEYRDWRREPCTESCRDKPARITRRATDLGVTPADDGTMAESVMESRLAAMGGEEWGKEELPGSVAMMPDANGQRAADAPSGAAELENDSVVQIDPQLAAIGEKVFRKCKACHAVGQGARNKTGPHLNDLLGRKIGGLADFRYSGAFEAAAQDNAVWDRESLAAFLADPKGYLKGTRMAFSGLRSDEDIAAVIAYLATATK